MTLSTDAKFSSIKSHVAECQLSQFARVWCPHFNRSSYSYHIWQDNQSHYDDQNAKAWYVFRFLLHFVWNTLFFIGLLAECRLYRHTFLKIHYGSGVNVKPNLIEGDSLLKTFSAGYYHAKEQPLTAGLTVDSTHTITVRPKSPFAVSSATWSKSWTVRYI